MSTPRYASGGFVPPKHPNCRSTLTLGGVYRLLALSPIDPDAESWRWQRAGYLAKVLLQKAALRGAR